MAGNRRCACARGVAGGAFSAWIRHTDPVAILQVGDLLRFPRGLRRRHAGRSTANLVAALDQGDAALPAADGAGRACHAASTRACPGFPVRRLPDLPTIDLKLYGLRPFVEAARINALRFGVAHTNTAQRLRLAAPALHVSTGDMRAIVDAFYFIQLLRLRHQQFEPDAERAPNRIDPDGLNAFDRRILKESFRQGRDLQQRWAPFPAVGRSRRRGRMSRMTLTGQRLVALFLLGCLLLNFPLLYLFESDLVIANVPLLFVHELVAWAALIVLLALVVERGGDDAE